MPDASKPSASRRFSRRKFLKRALKGTVVSGLGALGYAYWVEPHWVDVVCRPLPLAHLPEQLVGRRLIQISDLHVGENLNPSYMAKALASIADLQPDLLVITGDFMTCHDAEQVDSTVDVLRHLPKTPLGSFAILGNHDYGRAWRQYQVAQQLGQRVADLGIRMLRNEVADVAGLQIAGMDDLWSGRSLPGPTLQQLDAARAKIVLCHNPDTVDLPYWQDYQGWILAGHTHGGQCSAPWYGPPILPVRNKSYTSGEIELAGGRRLYINRGLGYTRRVRFNCRPEITVFTLTREPSALAKAERQA